MKDVPKIEEKTEVEDEIHQSTTTTREQNGNEDDETNQQISEFMTTTLRSLNTNIRSFGKSCYRPYCTLDPWIKKQGILSVPGIAGYE